MRDLEGAYGFHKKSYSRLTGRYKEIFDSIFF